MIFKITSSLLVLIYGITIMYLLLDIKLRTVPKRNLYILLIFAVAVVSVNIFVLKNYPIATYGEYYPLLVHIPVCLGFSIISKFKGWKLAFVLFTAIVFSTPLVVIPFTIGSFFDYNPQVILYSHWATYLPMIFLVKKYFCPSFHYMLKNRDTGWFHFSIIPISYYLITYSLGKYNFNAVTWNEIGIIRILLLVLIFSVYLLLLGIFKQTREQLITQNEQNVLKMQLAASSTHLQALKDSEEKIIIYRHDLRHNLHIIDGFLQNQNTAAAQNHIHQIIHKIDATIVTEYCKNPGINLILSSYINRAKKEGILVDTQIVIPSTARISEIDLCTIFANMIDNAINACLKVLDKNKRKIRIRCHCKNDSIYIQVTNKFEGIVKFADGIPINQQENHGIGTKSIVHIVHKYNGLFDFSITDDVFIVRLII